MTVTELRDALNALIEQGHGELPVAHYSSWGYAHLRLMDVVDDGDGPSVILD